MNHYKGQCSTCFGDLESDNSCFYCEPVNPNGFYVYDMEGEQIAYLNATNILEARKEAQSITGMDIDDLSIERA